MKYFWIVCFALLCRMIDPRAQAATAPSSAATPQERTDWKSQTAHTQLLQKAQKGGIDVYFEGDSITRRWGATDYPQFLANWKQNFHGWNAADFGWGGDKLENILWRLEHWELDGVNPKVIVFLAGTNNIGYAPGGKPDPEDMLRGFKEILQVMEAKAPGATIILTAIFPRNDNMSFLPVINQVNQGLAQMADGKKIRFLNINSKLADDRGHLYEDMMNPDHLHPVLKGYQVWADALKPILTELLGPPAKTDHAPPPTGDPGASR